MKRYLIPVDGSGGSERALSYAIERAREAKAEVHVLHVVPAPEYDDLNAFEQGSEIANIRHQAHQRILGSAMNELKAAGIPCAAHLFDGQPAEIITRFAESQKIDEIIIGSHGRSAVRSVLLGSVSDKVTHLARMPVTVVK